MDRNSWPEPVTVPRAIQTPPPEADLCFVQRIADNKTLSSLSAVLANRPITATHESGYLRHSGYRRAPTVQQLAGQTSLF